VPKSVNLRIYDCPADRIPDIMDRVGAEFDVDQWREEDDHVFVFIGEASDNAVREEHFQTLSNAIDEEAGAHCTLRVEVLEGDNVVDMYEYQSDAWDEIALGEPKDVFTEQEEVEDSDSW